MATKEEKKDIKLVNTSVSFTPLQVKRLDDFVKKGYFHNRSEAVRQGVLLLFTAIDNDIDLNTIFSFKRNDSHAGRTIK